ncbi:MAG: ABC transporter permease [Acidimicrobiaceae bacterium]|nr:ABC transporter permease [Acidimicrobiaceae bacterium]
MSTGRASGEPLGHDEAGGQRKHALRIEPTDLLLRYGIVLVWVAIAVVFSILRPDTFFTFGNLETIAGSQAVLVFVSLALLPTLIAGEFDVSVSSVTGISLVLIGWLNVLHHWPIGWSIAVALGVGLSVGAVNAFFVVVTQVPSIIVTLGMGTLLTGVTIGINSLSTGGISPGLVNAAHDDVLGLPLAFFYGVLVTALIWYVLSHTPLGRYLYFVGASRNVARLSGLPVSGIRAGAFVAGSLMSALAGVLLAGWLSASDPNVGPTFLLPAFAAAFLGSSVLEPGRFNPWGAFIAVYFLVTGVTGLELLGVAGWIEQVFYGGSLILAVAISRFASRRRLAV